MFTELQRSRVHLALTSTLNIPERPDTDIDRRKAGIALTVARYSGDSELAAIFAAADAIEDLTCSCAATFDIHNVISVTGLTQAACEMVLMLIGACQRGPLSWTVNDGERMVLPQNLMQQWVENNFPQQRHR